MAKKVLTSFDLRGDLLINGAANTNANYVLTSNGAGAISWAAGSSFGYIGDTQTTSISGGITTLSGVDTIVSSTDLTVQSSNPSSVILVTTAAGTLTSGSITLQTGTTSTSSGTSGALVFNTGAGAGTANSSGSIEIKTGAASGTNGSSGNIVIDSGIKAGSGAAGTVTVGTTNASSVTIGRTGGSTTIAGTLTAVPTFPSTAQQLFLASPNSGSGTPTFRYIHPNDFTQSSSPSLGQALVYAPVTGGWSWGTFASTSGATFSGGVTFAAPTTSISSITLTTGTLPSLANQAFGQLSSAAETVQIGTTKTTGAGPGFGVINAPQMVFSLADAGTASSTTGVAAFAAANDVLSSLEANKLYRFRGKYYVTYTAGGTAAALQLLFAFGSSANPQAIKYTFRTTKSTSATTFDQVGIGAVATGVTVSTSTLTGGTFVVEFDGYLTSHATLAGSLTPQIAASGSTAGNGFVVTTGSWFEIQKIGTATQTLIAGNWA